MGRDEAFYFNTLDGRGPCFACEGWLSCFSPLILTWSAVQAHALPAHALLMLCSCFAMLCLCFAHALPMLCSCLSAWVCGLNPPTHHEGCWNHQTGVPFLGALTSAGDHICPGVVVGSLVMPWHILTFEAKLSVASAVVSVLQLVLQANQRKAIVRERQTFSCQQWSQSCVMLQATHARTHTAGHKQQLQWFRSYIVAVLSTPQQQDLPPTYLLQVFDLRNKLIAISIPLPEVCPAGSLSCLFMTCA